MPNNSALVQALATLELPLVLVLAMLLLLALRLVPTLALMLVLALAMMWARGLVPPNNTTTHNLHQSKLCHQAG